MKSYLKKVKELSMWLFVSVVVSIVTWFLGFLGVAGKYWVIAPWRSDTGMKATWVYIAVTTLLTLTVVVSASIAVKQRSKRITVEKEHHRYWLYAQTVYKKQNSKIKALRAEARAKRKAKG